MWKASVGVAASLVVSATASAQCDTFRKADAANPLTGLVPAGKNLSGFDFVDIDADGDPDLYMYYSTETAPHFFRNTGNATHPVFAEEAVSGFTSTVKSYALGNMQFADIDGDGDYDFFLSDYNRYLYTDAHIHYYKNTGTPQVPQFAEDTANNPVRMASSNISVAFTFADVDSDGDLDFYYVYADEYGNPPFEYLYKTQARLPVLFTNYPARAGLVTAIIPAFITTGTRTDFWIISFLITTAALVSTGEMWVLQKCLNT